MEAKEQQTYPPILDIPVEVWVELMGHINNAKDLVHLSITCKLALTWTVAHENASWRNIFKNRFPAFYQVICREEEEEERKNGRKTERTWREVSRNVLEGDTKFRVQVYNRENHPGFRMSCYDAEASYRKSDGKLDVKYLAPLDRTEVIPLSQCRIVPAVYRTLDPFTRFEGGDSIMPKKGEFVEVQWRSSTAHPFGYWHGEIESVEGRKVKVVFKQFAKDDIFYSISFDQPGMKNMQQGQGAGIYGGFAVLSPQENAQWASFEKPKEA